MTQAWINGISYSRAVALHKQSRSENNSKDRPFWSSFAIHRDKNSLMRKKETSFIPLAPRTVTEVEPMNCRAGWTICWGRTMMRVSTCGFLLKGEGRGGRKGREPLSYEFSQAILWIPFGFCRRWVFWRPASDGGNRSGCCHSPDAGEALLPGFPISRERLKGQS